MNAVRALLAVAVLSLVGCGPAVRIFRGTNTTAVTSSSGTGTGTSTTSTNGALVKIYSTTEPDTWDFEIGGGGAFVGGSTWKTSTNGTTVTFVTGQTITTTTSQSGSSTTVTTTTTLSGGTGTLDQTQLTLNLQGTQTIGTGTGTFTTSFAGVKE